MQSNENSSDTHRSGEPVGYSDPVLIQKHTQVSREKTEPTEGFAPAPTIVIIFICALASFCFFYLEHNTHGFSSSVFDNDQVDGGGAVAKGPVVETIEMRIKKGEKIFNQQCSTCHQADGKGTPGVYPPLAGSPFVEGDETRAISIVIAGIGGPIEVLGNKFNNNMPELGSSLKDKQIADVLTYVRQAWGHKEPPVAPEKVAEVRKELGKRGPWTAPELLKAHPLEAK
jgi:mono/diheme cytochrome c family protein